MLSHHPSYGATKFRPDPSRGSPSRAGSAHAVLGHAPVQKPFDSALGESSSRRNRPGVSSKTAVNLKRVYCCAPSASPAALSHMFHWDIKVC